MSDSQLTATATLTPETSRPGARRRAAAVIAQYIQDLSRPEDPAPCAAAA